MNTLVGTSGYSYKEWKGVFYPEKLPATKMLEYYASRLPAVEINNTFYKMPKTSVLQAWGEQVPVGFRFAIKASRRITHIKRLKDVGEETAYLLKAVEVLEQRLGVLLFQLPPNLRFDGERLARFLDLLPDGLHAAFEFRHASWFDSDVATTLADRGRALCLVDDAAQAGDDLPVAAGPPWGYLRLRRPGYDDAALNVWAQRVRSQPWETAYIFFKHEDEGAGPKLAARFQHMLQTSDV